MAASTFYRLSRTLLVKDICSQVVCDVDCEEPADELFSYWAVNALTYELDRWDDGTGSIVIMTSRDGIMGWYDLKLHDYDREIDESGGAIVRPNPIKDFATPITEADIIEADTPILSAVRRMVDSPNGLLVVHANKIIGLLRGNDLYKMEARMCIFSLILAIEEAITTLMIKENGRFVNLLRTGNPKEYERKKKRIINEKKHYGFVEAELLSREGFKEKVDLLTKDGLIQQYVADWRAFDEKTELNQVRTLVNLRNKIAHYHTDYYLSVIISPHNLFNFIQWMLNVLEALEKSMADNLFVYPEELANTPRIRPGVQQNTE